MKVESIDYSDKYNLVLLTIEGEEFSINYDMYNNLFVQKDDDISFDTYKDIIAEDEFNRAKNFALGKISYSQKSSFEIRKLMAGENYSELAIDKTLRFLEEYGLIDDRSYVRSFVADKHNIARWSKNKIRYGLLAKKVTEDLIEEFISQIPYEEEYEKAKDFAIRKARDDYSASSKQKVYRYLSSKGFDYDIISKVVGELFK